MVRKKRKRKRNEEKLKCVNKCGVEKEREA
jgi:hypothetical protein